MKPDPRPVWRAIVAAGALMPVSDTERARAARVKAAHCTVWGLPHDINDDEFIDARAGDKRSRAELAGRYLVEYAALLDPDGDLEDVDRAAIPWRTTTATGGDDAAELFAALAALGNAAETPPTEQMPLFEGAFADLLAGLE